MNDSSHSTGRGGRSFGPWSFGPRTLTLVCGCALAATAYALGAKWLGTSFAGLPIGVWGVLGATVGAHVLSRRGRRIEEPPLEERGTVGLVEEMVSAEHESGNVLACIAGEGSAAVTSVRQLALRSARQVDEAKRRLERLSRRLATGRSAAAVRIGVDLCERDFRALAGAVKDNGGESGGVEWCRAEAGLITDGPRDSERYDALIRRGSDGRLVVFVYEDDTGGGLGGAAAWFDWGQAMPLGYPAVFPGRLDCARVTLRSCDLDEPMAALLVARLSIAAAVTGRTLARVSSGTRGGRGRSALPDGARAVAGAMNDLADAMLSVPRRPGSGVVSAARAAARVISAYVASGEAEVLAGDRVHLAQTAMELLGDEPEVALRAAAVQLAAAGGTAPETQELFVRAFERLRGGGVACETDPLAFVMSEAELGSADRLTLGRICAGVCLAWSTTPSQSMDYLRDDLIDDLRHAGWLSIREEDVRELREVIELLEGQMVGGAGRAGTLLRAA